MDCKGQEFDLISVSRYFLETEYQEFRILMTILFHSVMIQEKNENLKASVLH